MHPTSQEIDNLCDIHVYPQQLKLQFIINVDLIFKEYAVTEQLYTSNVEEIILNTAKVYCNNEKSRAELGFFIIRLEPTRQKNCRSQTANLPKTKKRLNT